MTRFSTFCVLSGTLAVLAFSANVASAGNLTVHTTAPNIKVQAPKTGGNVKGSHSSGGDRPTESVTLSYTKMNSAYKPQNTPSGSSYTPPLSVQQPTVSVNTHH